MSFQAIVWALAQQAPSSSAKLLLTAIANFARSEDSLAWPSVKHLTEVTQQDRKTVLGNLRALESAGLICAAGKTGKTGQVTVWRLPPPTTRNGAEFGTPPEPECSTEIGTLSESETVPHSRGKSTNIPAKQSQEWDTEPVIEPVIDPKRVRKRAIGFDAAQVELPSWLPREAWLDWVDDRKERRIPTTERAAKAQLKTLERYRGDGHEPIAVIEQSIASGYKGLVPPKSCGSVRKPLTGAARPDMRGDNSRPSVVAAVAHHRAATLKFLADQDAIQPTKPSPEVRAQLRGIFEKVRS